MNPIKIGQAIQFHDGATGGVYAAQVTHAWSEQTVNLVFWDPNGATWRERNSVPRLMWAPSSSGHPTGFATLDQEGIAK